MTPRTEEIVEIFRGWLERFSPPASIKGNGKAMQASADALLRVLLKYAPQDEAGPWVRRALDQLEYQMKTRAWPTVNELGAACVNLRRETGETADFKLDPYEIAARRIHAGQHVGDGWLYGTDAHTLINRGLVLEADLRRYRSAAFFALKSVYGEETARAMEADLIQRHELAGDRLRLEGAA